MASKYFGLIFAGAAGLVAIWHRRWLKFGAAFAAAALAAGFQWYLWNWIHTGDPIFPTLTNLLGFPDSGIWSRDFGAYFTKLYRTAENPLDRSILNWLLYPVYATFDIEPRLEGGRTGLGILVALVLPLAVAGMTRLRDRRREVGTFLALATIFYTVWFFSGTTQRVRHLLPVYPLLLIATVWLAHGAAVRYRLTGPLAAAAAATIAVQLAGQGVFTANYAKYVFSDETRAAFLDRNVLGANAVNWINTHLSAKTRTAYLGRRLMYLFDVPAFMMHPHVQAVINVRPTTHDPARFIAQARKHEITHFLFSGNWMPADRGDAEETTPFFQMIIRLIDLGCLVEVKTFHSSIGNSRTLGQFGAKGTRTSIRLYKIDPGRCPSGTS